jgi:hypothetical protein
MGHLIRIIAIWRLSFEYRSVFRNANQVPIFPHNNSIINALGNMPQRPESFRFTLILAGVWGRSTPISENAKDFLQEDPRITQRMKAGKSYETTKSILEVFYPLMAVT